MRTPLLIALLGLLGAAPLQAAPDPPATMRLTPGSNLQVSGTATIGAFTCRTSTMRLDRGAHVGDGLESADVRVPAAKLDCGNRIINGHMRATLRAEENPEIALQLSFAETLWMTTGGEARLEGTLTLGGTERPVTVTAMVEPGADGALRIRGTHALLLSDYGLKTPSFLMRMLTVHDRVTVRFDLGLVR